MRISWELKQANDRAIARVQKALSKYGPLDGPDMPKIQLINNDWRDGVKLVGGHYNLITAIISDLHVTNYGHQRFDTPPYTIIYLPAERR